jgi:hypothetical protein
MEEQPLTVGPVSPDAAALAHFASVEARLQAAMLYPYAAAAAKTDALFDMAQRRRDGSAEGAGALDGAHGSVGEGPGMSQGRLSIGSGLAGAFGQDDAASE